MEQNSSDLRRIRVGMVAPAVLNLPLWVAVEDGAFADAGLAVKTSVIGSTDGTTAALLAGDVDVALATAEPALADPDRVVVLAGLADRPPLSLVAAPHLTSVEDLRGVLVGTTSLTEGTVHLVRTILARHGLHDPADYGFTLAGAHPQRWQALREGTLQAALQLMPFDQMAEEAGFSILARAEDVVPAFAFAAACVTTAWQATEPEVVEAVAASLRAGERSIREHPGRAAEVAGRHAQLREEHARRSVERLVDGGVMPVDLRFSPEAMAQTRAALAALSAS